MTSNPEKRWTERLSPIKRRLVARSGDRRLPAERIGEDSAARLAHPVTAHAGGPVKTFYVKKTGSNVDREQGICLSRGRFCATRSRLGAVSCLPALAATPRSGLVDRSAPCSGVKAAYGLPAYGLPALTPCARRALLGPTRAELVAPPRGPDRSRHPVVSPSFPPRFPLVPLAHPVAAPWACGAWANTCGS